MRDNAAIRRMAPAAPHNGHARLLRVHRRFYRGPMLKVPVICALIVNSAPSGIGPLFRDVLCEMIRRCDDRWSFFDFSRAQI